MSGRVRLARITDLAALGELSRLSQQEHVDARSLGLPVSGPRIGVFSLFRLPLGAFRPNDLLFVYEDERRLSGLLRVERDASRDEMDDRRARRHRLGRQRRHALPDGPAPAARRRQARRHPFPRRLLRTARATWSCSCRPASPATARRTCCSASPSSELPPRLDRGALAGGRDPALPAARRPAAGPALRRGDAAAGGSPRVLPPVRLGAPGLQHPRAPFEPGPDPALRRDGGLRAGGRHRRAWALCCRSASPARISPTTSRSWPCRARRRAASWTSDWA